MYLSLIFLFLSLQMLLVLRVYHHSAISKKKKKPALLLTITEFPPGGKSAWFAIYNHDMSAHTTDS